MIDLLAASVISGFATLTLWLRADGPARLYAAIIAVGHADSSRRRDARAVLRCTGRTPPPQPSSSRRQQHSTRSLHRRAKRPIELIGYDPQRRIAARNARF